MKTVKMQVFQCKSNGRELQEGPLEMTDERAEKWELIRRLEDVCITAEVWPGPMPGRIEEGMRPVETCLEHEEFGDFMSVVKRNPFDGGPKGEEGFFEIFDKFDFEKYSTWVADRGGQVVLLSEEDADKRAERYSEISLRDRMGDLYDL